jgi:hypothetical protein
MYVEEKREGEVQVPTLDPIQRLLLKAAEIVEQRGWCQRSFENLDGQVCALGAINLAHHDCSGWGSRVFSGADLAVNAACRASQYVGRGIGYFTLANWNDTNGRTKEEVIAALRGAAK